MHRAIAVLRNAALYTIGREWVMGLPAFKEQFDELTTASRAVPVRMPSNADITSFTSAAIIRPINAVVDKINAQRVLYIRAARSLPEKYSRIEKKEREELISAIAAAEKYLKTLSAPILSAYDGRDTANLMDELAESWSKRSSADGRLARRLAKKLREAAAPCDVQRLRLVAVITQLLEQMRADLAVCEEAQSRNVNRNEHDELFMRSIKRYPRITAYLGR